VPTRLGNQRDLLLALLADALYVERRLAGEVLPSLVRAVEDRELKEALEAHLAETRGHAAACEAAFLELGAAPSAGYSDAFEGLVRQHAEAAAKIGSPGLRDLWHATAAAHAEHYELATYGAAIRLGSAHGLDVSRLEEVAGEEERALRTAEAAVERLAREGR
jgi:ferritin-like metal-binding protein YciE